MAICLVVSWCLPPWSLPCDAIVARFDPDRLWPTSLATTRRTSRGWNGSRNLISATNSTSFVDATRTMTSTSWCRVNQDELTPVDDTRMLTTVLLLFFSLITLVPFPDVVS